MKFLPKSKCLEAPQRFAFIVMMVERAVLVLDCFVSVDYDIISE